MAGGGGRPRGGVLIWAGGVGRPGLAFRVQARRQSPVGRAVSPNREPQLVTQLSPSPDEDRLARSHASPPVGRGAVRSLAAGPWLIWLFTLLLLAPVLLAIWTVPGF